MLVLATAAVACSRSLPGACPVGCGAASTELSRATVEPTKAPAQWTLAELAGVYAWGCEGESWATTTLTADGSFINLWHAESGDSTTRGKIVRAGDTLTLSDKPAHLADRLSHHALRMHRGRRVLVGTEQVEDFDLLPSWWLGSVRLRAGEDRSDLCDDIAPRPEKNPPSPNNPNMRLPPAFTVTFPVRDPGGSTPTTVEVQSAPWWVQAAVCPQGCGTPKQLALRRSGDWARLNRLWWAAAAAPERCPGGGAAAEAYTLTSADETVTGDLAGVVQAEAIPADPCTARAQLVRWISDRVHTMHPPRPSGPPRR